MKIDSAPDYNSGFEILKQLQNLEDKVLPLSAHLRGTLLTIQSLQSANELFTSKGFYPTQDTAIFSNELRAHETTLQGHILSIELLEKRIRGVLEMLAVALNLKNQITAAENQATAVEINQGMLHLTQDTVDDSATVRVVTLVTLIYLPASFIASILGMNLFSFQDQTKPGSGFQISSEFWVFIALSAPLTLLTVGSWFFISYKRRVKRELWKEKREEV